MNTNVLSSLMQHYFFRPGQNGTWDSTTNEIIAQFADRYNCNSTQRLHTLGGDWNLERRLDTPGFIFRITDKLTDVDDDQGRYQDVSFEVYYDRKVGNIRPGLKNNIFQLIKRSGLEKTFKPDYRDEWFHCEGEFKDHLLEKIKQGFWNLHMLIDRYMRENKHLNIL